MQLSNLFNVDARVYIAGVQMPFNTLSVSSAFNNFPRCTISIPPDPRLYGIGRNDRVPVQVFVANTFCGEDDTYLLFFEGEIESFGYVNNSISREFVINAQSNLAFLRDVNVSLLSDLESYAQAMLPAAGASAINASGHVGFNMPASLYFQGLGNVSTNGDIIKYPYEFLDNVRVFLTGDHENAPQTALSRFYSSYTKMLRFSDRFSKVPYFDDGRASWGSEAKGFPVLSGLQSAVAVNRVTGLMSQGPQQGSIYDLLNYVVSNLEYELAMFNAPSPASGGGINSLCLKPMFYDATPPVCNVLFRSSVDSLRSNEQVYSVPTRVRTRDVSGVFPNLTQGSDSVFSQIGMLDYYPTVSASGNANLSPKDLFNSELLESERHTGPFLAEAQAPMWLSYINPKFLEGSEGAIGEQTRRHMYLLKRYENRTLSVSSVFNPFVTPGFPGVVFDSEDQKETGFTFVGHVLSATHTISKGGASTTVTLGFTRTLEEEVQNRLGNSLEILNEVTHSASKMSEIYQQLLGCASTDFGELAANGGNYEEQVDPFSMYAYNRRDLVTLEDYAAFMGASVSSDQRKLDDAGDGYFSGRRDAGLVSLLEEIAEEAFRGEIYSED